MVSLYRITATAGTNFVKCGGLVSHQVYCVVLYTAIFLCMYFINLTIILARIKLEFDFVGEVSSFLGYEPTSFKLAYLTKKQQYYIRF